LAEIALWYDEASVRYAANETLYREEVEEEETFEAFDYVSYQGELMRIMNEVADEK
jgi:hypothetical protein